jgi:hypothetical protein
MPFDGRVLSDDEIRTSAPSVFSIAPSPKVSDRYAYIASYPVVRQLRAMQMHPVEAREGRVKAPDGRIYAKHRVRFRKFGADWEDQTRELGMLVPMIDMVNSHDRTSPISFSASIGRLACLNGMVVQQEGYHFTVRHTGKDRAEQVHNGISTIIGRFGELLSVCKRWQSIQLDASQQKAFAEKAVEIRGTSLAVDLETVLKPHRNMDLHSDLWTVFNVVQENLTRGNVEGQTARGQRRHVNRVVSLTSDIDLNRKLWAHAATIAGERDLVAA